jgi:hypothetical protein
MTQPDLFTPPAPPPEPQRVAWVYRMETSGRLFTFDQRNNPIQHLCGPAAQLLPIVQEYADERTVWQ